MNEGGSNKDSDSEDGLDHDIAESDGSRGGSVGVLSSHDSLLQRHLGVTFNRNIYLPLT